MNSVNHVKKLLGSLLNFPSKLLLDFNLKRLKKIVIAVTAVLLSVILFLGWMFARKVREVVVDDFNQQQLVLARHAASKIKNSLEPEWRYDIRKPGWMFFFLMEQRRKS